MSTGEVFLEMPLETTALFTARWSPDGERIAIGCIHGREIGAGALIWDASTRELQTDLQDLGGGTGRTEWVSDGRRIVSSHGSPEGNVIRLWNFDTGNLLHAFTGHDIFLWSVHNSKWESCCIGGYEWGRKKLGLFSKYLNPPYNGIKAFFSSIIWDQWRSDIKRIITHTSLIVILVALPVRLII